MSPGSVVGAQTSLTEPDAGRAKVLQHHSVPVDTGEQLQHEHVWPPRLVISNPLHLNPAAAAGLAGGRVAALSPAAQSLTRSEDVTA